MNINTILTLLAIILAALSFVWPALDKVAIILLGVVLLIGNRQ